MACRAQASTPNETISPNVTPPQSQAATADVAPGTRTSSVPSVASLTGRRLHRDYVRSRARQIAYGRWQPWAETADPVRQHVRLLQRAGGSYRAVARAAGVSPTTVCRLCRDDPPRGLPPACTRLTPRRLLAVTPGALRQGMCGRSSARRPSAGHRPTRAPAPRVTAGRRRWAWTTTASMTQLPAAHPLASRHWRGFSGTGFPQIVVAAWPPSRPVMTLDVPADDRRLLTWTRSPPPKRV